MISHAIALSNVNRPGHLQILEPESAEKNWPVIFNSPPTLAERDEIYQKLLLGEVVKHGDWVLEPITDVE